MEILKGFVEPAACEAGLAWIMRRSEHPTTDLEPEFDIGDDERRLAKKIRRLFWVDEPFWSEWFRCSGLRSLAEERLAHPRLIRHAAFIKRAADESFIPLHQDIALWERKYETATTFWLALTDARKDNGGLFYHPTEDIIYDHHLDLKYPMFRSIAEDDPRLDHSLITPVEADPGDVVIWRSRTPHGSYTNEAGRLRVTMPVVFVEEYEYNTHM